VNIIQYLGMPYDIHGEIGVNCWTLYSLIKKQEQGIDVVTFKPKVPNAKGIENEFINALETGSHNHFRVNQPQDFDLVLMTKQTKKRKIYHCGVFFKGDIIHARGTSRTGQVWLQSIEELNNYNLEYWRCE